jgi:hypothetical protein
MQNYRCGLLALVIALAGSACGDDDDDGSDGAGCAHVQEICKDSESVTIDCDDWDKAPASVRSCASKAKDCDAVLSCIAGG